MKTFFFLSPLKSIKVVINIHFSLLLFHVFSTDEHYIYTILKKKSLKLRAALDSASWTVAGGRMKKRTEKKKKMSDLNIVHRGKKKEKKKAQNKTCRIASGIFNGLTKLFLFLFMRSEPSCGIMCSESLLFSVVG